MVSIIIMVCQFLTELQTEYNKKRYKIQINIKIKHQINKKIKMANDWICERIYKENKLAIY